MEIAIDIENHYHLYWYTDSDDNDYQRWTIHRIDGMGEGKHNEIEVSLKDDSVSHAGGNACIHSGLRRYECNE